MRVIYTHHVTVAAKESPVSYKNRKCSGAKVGCQPFSLQTPFFSPAVSRVLETHSFFVDREGTEGLNDAIGTPFFFL